HRDLHSFPTRRSSDLASTLEVVCQGLGFAEGPIAMPDRSILLVDIRKECLTQILPNGSQKLVAKVPGGPNGAAVGPDGRINIAKDRKSTRLNSSHVAI